MFQPLSVGCDDVSHPLGGAHWLGYMRAVARAPARPTFLADLDVNRLNLVWLTRLRWASIVGQTLTVLGVEYAMRVPLPLAALGTLIAIEAASNAAVAVWLSRHQEVGEAPLVALIAFDVVLFSALLYFTGGPTNPFSSLYLIHIALATLVLRPRFTWALVALSLLCSGALFLIHVPLAMMVAHDHASMGQYGLHLKGMWVALGVSASFIVYFLSRVTRALAERDAALEQARERDTRHRQMAALATLAAGAAHELAQPLSIIAVLAKEIERGLDGDSARADDVRLVRAQVARCKEILGELAADAGQARGDADEPSSIDEVISAALDGLADADRVDRKFERPANASALVSHRRLVSRALRGVVQNALDATRGGGGVEIAARVNGDRVELAIRDEGGGMPEEVRRRATDPFFTTKPVGEGMGLGLFLAASIVDQLGGELRIESQPGAGACVTLEVPR